MRYAVARAIGGQEPKGYRITFHVRSGSIVSTDGFPDRDEQPFLTLAIAKSEAEAFAERAPSNYGDIYIVDADTFVPIKPMWILRPLK